MKVLRNPAELSEFTVASLARWNEEDMAVLRLWKDMPNIPILVVHLSTLLSNVLNIMLFFMHSIY